MRNQTMRCWKSWFVLLAAAAWASTAAAAEPQNMGRIFLAGPGGSEARGQEIAEGEVVRTVNDFAILHLGTGHVLRLESNSAVIFASGENGAVDVNVLAGRVSLVDPRGRVRRAGATSRFALRPTSVDAREAEARLLETDPPEPRDRRSARDLR
jgi:hypothetical protein